MLDNTAYHLACRNRARTLVVATTGVLSLAATSTGYTRASGSFYDDGFWKGMEIIPAGFSSNTPRVLADVTPTTITVTGSVPVQAAAGGRSLTAGLPSNRLWEDIPLTNASGAPIPPPSGAPYIEEQYIDGPSSQITIGPNGELEAMPMYVLIVGLAADNGLTLHRYTDALLRLFSPRTAMTLPSGDILRVRADVAPYASQLTHDLPGFSVKTFRVPLIVRTQNPI